jgi:cytochrome c oxidase subunit 1
MFVNLFLSLFRGEKAGENPWGGATLEWQISSPPPKENFEKIPVVEKGPYEYR